MEATIEIPQRPSRYYLPDNFSISNKEELVTFFQDLIEREINSVQELESWLADFSELSDVVGEEVRWRYVKTSIDTQDAKALENLQFYYKEIEPTIKVYTNKIMIKLNDSPFTDELKKNPDFKNFLKAVAIDLKIFNNENVELQKDISIKTNEYDSTTGLWNIEHDGKTLTFQQAQVLLKDKDRSVRETVYKKIVTARLKDEEKLDKLYSELISMRDKMAKNSSYANFRDYSFDAKHRFDYTPEDCEEFHDSIAATIVPVLNELSEKRKKAMKLDVLKPWDRMIDEHGRDSLKPFEDTEEFVNKTIECFNQLDPYFGERLAIMKEMEYLDLESRKGKAAGGYNMTMPEIGVPFIFMNHAKSEGDVRVMVHEGGHAVHTFLAHPLKYGFFKEYPSEVAELASMSMELFSMENWESFYEDEEELNRAKKNHLIGLLNTLPGVAKGDKFQHWVYLNPNHTIEERKNKWESLSKEFGVNNVDYKGLEDDIRSSYQRVLHFYQVPFYYIEYGFAQLGAIAMWRNYKLNPEETIANYKKALSLGYTRSISEIYETAGIKFDFSKKYMNELAKFVKEEIDKLG